MTLTRRELLTAQHRRRAMAYHSTNPSDPDVYHESDSCPTGQIPASNRAPGRGTGNRPYNQCAA